MTTVTKTKYYSIGAPLDPDAVYDLADSVGGVAVALGKPGFCCWWCLKVRGSVKRVDAAFRKVREAGIVFERRRPIGAFECPEPEEGETP